MNLTLSDLNKIQDALMSRDPIKCAIAESLIVSAKDAAADGVLIAAAQAKYGSDDIEIDDDAGTSPADNGTWVQAWLWIAEGEATTSFDVSVKCEDPHSMMNGSHEPVTSGKDFIDSYLSTSLDVDADAVAEGEPRGRRPLTEQDIDGLEIGGKIVVFDEGDEITVERTA